MLSRQMQCWRGLSVSFWRAPVLLQWPSRCPFKVLCLPMNELCSAQQTCKLGIPGQWVVKIQWAHCERRLHHITPAYQQMFRTDENTGQLGLVCSLSDVKDWKKRKQHIMRTPSWFFWSVSFVSSLWPNQNVSEPLYGLHYTGVPLGATLSPLSLLWLRDVLVKM